MKTFELYNPTRLIVGEKTIAQLKELVQPYNKIMVTYGGGSIKKNGVYDEVIKALEGKTFIEFSGIEANPDYATLSKAVAIVKSEKIDFLLAVGGGSILDGTKFIAAASRYEGDTWEMVKKHIFVDNVIPMGSVLTLPATGSEMNCGGVVSRRETKEKFSYLNPLTYPVFSILDPKTTFSLPDRQLANGVVDTFAHTLEQYLTFNQNAVVQDRFSEGILMGLIEIGAKVLTEKDNLETRANFMFLATMGLNGLIGVGVTHDWATHMIGHELTALCGLDHGLTLAIVYPGIMRVMKKDKWDKLVRYASNVWKIDINAVGEERAIDLAIEKTENFFTSLGLKIKLSQHNIGEDTITEIVKRFKDRGSKLGERANIDFAKVKEILESVR